VSSTRKPTATSSFGVGRREAHDASDFYARFTPPTLSDDETVHPYRIVDEIYCLDARRMDDDHERLLPNSVALVVTSPPYFAGKDYELALGTGHIPGDYVEYLQMLHDVFERCVEKLEPGGRIAVNVANLGRKPYRSLSADVITILQDRLGLLLRGEIIWRKGRGTSGSCAWGSYQSAANPVLRDLTERVIVASKGRFNRAVDRPHRESRGLPFENTISKDEYMEATLDVWELPTESATRVGHPAPFPVELPLRLIELYTYRDDLVVDPFMGSGSTAVAAVRSGRRFVGFDTDPDYVQAANERVRAERARLTAEPPRVAIRLPATKGPAPTTADEALAAGEQTRDLAVALLEEAGFTEVVAPKRAVAGVDVSLIAETAGGTRWHVEVVGGLTTGATGLRSSEAVWRTIGKATVLATAQPDARFLVVTPQLPPKGPLTRALDTASAVDAVVDVLAPTTPARLTELATAPPRRPGEG